MMPPKLIRNGRSTSTGSNGLNSIKSHQGRLMRDKSQRFSPLPGLMNNSHEYNENRATALLGG